MTSKFVDLAFPVKGDGLPLDHGYPLFAGLANRVPIKDHADWGVHPFLGAREGNVLKPLPHSFVKLRVPAGAIPGILAKLTGEMLTIDGCSVTLQAPKVFSLEPTAVLQSRMVVIKGYGVRPKAKEDEARQEMEYGVRQALSRLELGQDPERVEVHIGRRHVLSVGTARKRADGDTRRDRVVGFGVGLANLSADASLAVQEAGIGGKRHMGCGIFVPRGKR